MLGDERTHAKFLRDLKSIDLRGDWHWDQICARLKLSGRERDICELLLAGSSEQEMARHLRISSHTVHAHMERLFRKLDVNRRYALVASLFKAYVLCQYK